MKRLVSSARERLWLLRSSLRHSFQIETAYFGENWTGLLSTLTFTCINVLFIEALFRKVPNIAGYGQGEVLLLIFFSQLNYYMNWLWNMPSIQDLIRGVRNGSFDLLLTKPVPAQFYAGTRRILLVNFLRVAPPSLGVIALVIPWSSLGIQAGNLLIAMAIFVLGQLALGAIQGMLALPAFWDGGSEGLINIPYNVNGQYIPYEALPRWFSVLFTVVLPLMLPTAITTAVALGRIPALPTLGLVAVAVACIMWVHTALWKVALRHYTSASS